MCGGKSVGNKVLLVGLGRVGGAALNFLWRCPEISKLVAVDVDEEFGRLHVENTKLCGAIQGCYKPIEFIRADANDVEETSEVVRDVKPDLIVSTLTMPTPFISKLPEETRRKISRAGYSWVLPFQFSLVYKLMKALKKSGTKAPVVNFSYGDIVNPVLTKLGLEVTTGAGNLQYFVDGSMRMIVSEKLKVPIREVTVFALHHLCLSLHYGSFHEIPDVPLYYRIFVRDKDVTSKFDIKKLLSESISLALRPDRVWAFPPSPITARIFQLADGITRVVRCILNDTKEIVHVPGPIGLPGGWPVRLGVKPEVALPEDLTMKEAMRVMEAQQSFFGVEKIENDGTVLFSDLMAKTMRETFGYDHECMRPEESAEMAKELENAIRKRVSA
jgi:hypothetical protein